VRRGEISIERFLDQTTVFCEERFSSDRPT